MTTWFSLFGFPSTKIHQLDTSWGILHTDTHTHPLSLLADSCSIDFGCCERPSFSKREISPSIIFPTALYNNTTSPICSSGAIRGNRFQTSLGRGSKRQGSHSDIERAIRFISNQETSKEKEIVLKMIRFCLDSIDWQSFPPSTDQLDVLVLYITQVLT